jgi:hypothetical protein
VVITFAYDSHFWNMIDCWKGLDKEFHFIVSIMPSMIIEVPNHKKMFFRLSKFRTQKTAKNSKLPKNCFDPVRIGGWPPIYSWNNVINTRRLDIGAIISYRKIKKLWLSTLFIYKLVPK